MKDENQMGDFLAEKRKTAGLTQLDIAQHVEKHVQFISNIERNVAPPPAYIIKAYVHLCKIPQKEILEYMLKKREEWVRSNIFNNKSRKAR